MRLVVVLLRNVIAATGRTHEGCHAHEIEEASRVTAEATLEKVYFSAEVESFATMGGPGHPMAVDQPDGMDLTWKTEAGGVREIPLRAIAIGIGRPRKLF